MLSREAAIRVGPLTCMHIHMLNCCAEGMLGDDPKAKEEFEELAKQEMEVWKSIMSGAAVMEHMEDKYHDMLKVVPLLPS